MVHMTGSVSEEPTVTTPCVTESNSPTSQAETEAENRLDHSLSIPQSLVDQDPSELLRGLAALPRNHPSRPALRATTIEAWLPLAHHLASRLSGRGVPGDDLHQIAALGLIKAVDRYDPARGSEFVAFAVPTIMGELKRYFRDATWDVRVPRRLQDLRLRITDAVAELQQQLRRQPTLAEIADYLRISEDEVAEGTKGAQVYNAVSLQLPTHGDGAGDLADLLGEDDPRYDLIEFRAALGPALAALDERSRRIVLLRFRRNLTQTEIATEVGISQMHVSRLLARALARLAELIDPERVRVTPSRRARRR